MTTTTLRLLQQPWSAKKYIIAALLAALVTVAVATAISISLAPAHISFSVVYADTVSVAADGGGQVWCYNLTLEAHDTSRRREVQYGSLAADIWWSETKSMPTDEVNTAVELHGWQPPGSAPRVNLSVQAGHYDDKDNGAPAPPPPPPSAQTGNGNVNGSRVEWPDCRVVVQAKVWFRFGWIPTLPYTVTATCFPVNMVAGPVSVNCTS